MFFYHLYKKIRIEKDTSEYNKDFFPFIKEMKPNEEEDDDIKNYIIKYHEYLIRKKARIEEENTEEYKQKRELEKLEAELKNKQKVDAYSKYLISVMK